VAFLYLIPSLHPFLHLPFLSFILQASLHTLNVYSVFHSIYYLRFPFSYRHPTLLGLSSFLLFPLPTIVVFSYLFLQVETMSHGFSKMLSSILSCMLFFCMIDSALGHVQMEKPYPLHSPNNPKDTTGPKDYDMSSPLSPSGSNYPCKGYNKDISGVDSVETYTAGQSYSITFVSPITIAIYKLQELR